MLAVINKIDLPQSEPDRVKQEIEDMIGIDATSAPLVSAKTGQGIEELLDLLVDNIPSPEGDPSADFEALKSLDFETYRPKLICVEIYDENIDNSNINIFLKDLNYSRIWSATFSHLYTDNFINFN